MTLRDLNNNYIYQGDKSLDSWQEMKQDKNGKYVGDCEDYCITVKKNIPEFKDWDYYYCKLNGVGHCLLYKRGEIIDCNTKRIMSFDQYNLIYRVTNLRKYNWFEIFSKMLISKIILIYGKARGKQ